MSLDNLVTPKINLELQGQNWNVEFKLRNFAALKQVCNISENDLLQGLINGDVGKIPYAIWASTLVFAPFDPVNPINMERQLNLEELFNLSLAEMKEINDKIVQAMEAYLPKAPEDAKKKKTPKTKSMK